MTIRLPWPIGFQRRVILPPAAVMAAAATVALLAAACGGPEPTPTLDPRIDQLLERLDRLTERVERLEDRTQAAGPPPTTVPGPSPTPSPSARATPSPLPPPRAAPAPTPDPQNSGWARQRLDAVITLYDLTPEGAALLRSLDLRQMRGDPGFFGSYGFKEWAGVGEAKPTGVMHELAHSYWGGFPIEGSPELSWDTPPGETLSPAMKRYHADILAFMSQPPDGFEVFRQRLRNLPELSVDNPEPLFHNLEADLVYNTGGSLALVPPILRKYWGRLLKDGPFGSWYDAVGWYQNLPDEDRATANKYLGFEHLDLREYGPLPAPDVGTDPLAARRGALAREERQRLADLADQFDLLLGDPQKEENFQFWRGYLRDKVDLHRAHGDYLDSLALPLAPQVAAALDFLTGLDGLSPGQQARRLVERLPGQPFLVNFLPALDNRTLLDLFGSGVTLPEGPTLQATASFVQRLQLFAGMVERVLAAGRDDPRQGALQLQEYLSVADYEQSDDLRLFFELLREEDPAATGLVAEALDKTTIIRLMEPVPAEVRFALTPDALLAKLDITVEAEVPALKQGVAALMEKPSGNFIIDEPFLHRMYDVVARRGRDEAGDMLRVLVETPVPLEGFIQRQPEAATALLERDLEAALALVRQSDPLLAPPARIIYRLVYADPLLAARLVEALEQRRVTGLVVESLAHLAYDGDRSAKGAGLPISLEKDGRFLAALLERLGDEGLALRLAAAFTLFGGREAAGEVPAGFLSQYRATLDAAAATVSEAGVRAGLLGIIRQAAGGNAPAE